jgi:hypothetical protein
MNKRTKTTAPAPEPKIEDKTVRNGTTPRTRYASKEEFQKAQRKTSILHDGLFRRLSK